MDTKVTHILGHDADVMTMTPDEMLNHVMRAETLPRETNVLSSLLSASELCLQFIGGDRSQQGKMQQTTADQILNAASTQSFQVEPLPALNALRLRFDDDYLYGIHLPKSATIDFQALLQSLELESLRNAVISLENTRRMGFAAPAKNLDFLTQPLKNAALEMVLQRCFVAQGVFGKDGVRFAPFPAQALLERSTTQVYDVSGDPHSARFNIQMGGTIYPCTMMPTLPNALWQTMFDAIKSESELNRAYIRETDPEIAQLRERMKNAAFNIPGLHDEAPAVVRENTEDTTSVVPFRRR